MSKARPLDRDMPRSVDVHPLCVPPAWTPLGSRWHLAVESILPSPEPTDGEWDVDDWDTDAALWVDADTATTYFDVIGDVQGVRVTSGRSNVGGDMEAGLLRFTLDNRQGLYTEFAEDGTLHSYPPGQRVWLWVEHGGVEYPRFAGVVETWEENLEADDRPFATVDVTAVDSFLTFNTERDAGVYRLGSEGQRPAERLSFLAALCAYEGPTRFDLGDVTLRSVESTNPVLEEMHHTARSDGGVVFVDVDGALLYLGRGRMAGRLDQVDVPAFSDECDQLAASDGDPSTDASTMANLIRLKNLDDVEVIVQNEESTDLHRARRLSLDGLLWRTVAEGRGLGEFLLLWRGEAYYTVPNLVVMPHEGRPELFPVVYDLRVGDRVSITRTLPTGTVLTFEALVEGLVLDVLADGALRSTVTTSRAVA